MAWIPILASVAGGAASGAAGGKKGGGNDGGAANAQSQLAQKLFAESDPLRRSLIGRSESFLGMPPRDAASPGMTQPMGNYEPGIRGMMSGILADINGNMADSQGTSALTAGGAQGMGGDVRNTPTYLAFKSGADKTFQRAKDNVLATIPGGGGLAASLARLEGDRASSLTQGAGQIYENELSRALSLATGTTPTALNSLGQAAAIQSANANSAADRSAQKSGDFGAGLGEAIGSKT